MVKQRLVIFRSLKNYRRGKFSPSSFFCLHFGWNLKIYRVSGNIEIRNLWNVGIFFSTVNSGSLEIGGILELFGIWWVLVKI